ncbi:hypothetical protein NDU88_004361 [Pleurodeles waltl]|uniref:Uncharacterized protein n=1 Tax=Pleurodeles waltl TaxID=8319 RepID=A0AAV7W8R9_PLEWA|nr:hypothetical protein NDU88_004361 [Pleurodeles waltl]
MPQSCERRSTAGTTTCPVPRATETPETTSGTRISGFPKTLKGTTDSARASALDPSVICRLEARAQTAPAQPLDWCDIRGGGGTRGSRQGTAEEPRGSQAGSAAWAGGPWLPLETGAAFRTMGLAETVSGPRRSGHPWATAHGSGGRVPRAAGGVVGREEPTWQEGSRAPACDWARP